MKKWKNAKKTQPEESKRGEKVEKHEKNPAGGKQAGEKVEKREKNPARGKQEG